MAAARAAGDDQGNVKTYNKQMQAISEMRKAFNEAAVASGGFHTQTVQTISASEQLTKSISQQKVSWSQATRALRDYKAESKTGLKSVFGDAIRDQQKLRNAMAVQWTGNAFGKNSTDVYIPKGVGAELDSINTKYGMMNRLLYSAAANTVNWGKNTQWAGRQIMVGLTVPLGIAAIGAAAFAKKIDEQLTEVAKVYDTTADTAEGREFELAQVRETGLNQATRLAKEYGMAMTDTIKIQSNLAATGLSGNELFSATSETSRFATLGGIDTQTATDAMVSLKTAFRDSIPDAKSLTDTLNYFNAVENSTSLQTKDIAEALPRVASSMAATGVSAKELTVLLVSMRESGVDATIAANALKSGASTILDPTKEAVAYWKDSLGKDLPAIVKKAGGNMFEFLKEVSTELHGLDPQTVQTAITKTFGKYQFDRMTSLIGNLGDAMTGTGNQTAKAFELLGASSADLAETSDRELQNLQKSVSFRFKAAIEGLKAQLMPLGELALEVGTFLLNNVFEPILSFFNGLPKGLKVIGLSILGFGAIVGPLLMITGILANLAGSTMKFSLQLANLKTKFRATSIEEAAAAINAKTAASAFNTEATAAANLASKIGMLTTAMETNAVANGQMMAATKGNRMLGPVDVKGGGVIGAPGTTNTRTVRAVEGVSGNISHVYGYGSKDANGNSIAGRRVTDPADVRAFKEMQERTGQIKNDAEATKKSFGLASKAVGAIGAAAFIFTMIDTDATKTHETWKNIAMVVGTIAMMAPGMFNAPLAGAKKLLATLKTVGSGAITGKIAANMINVKSAFAAGGGGFSGLKAAAGTLGKMIPMALRIMGPVGIIAGGAIFFKHINDELTKSAKLQEALGASAETWANVVGYEFTPGKLPGIDEKSNNIYAERVKLVNDMKEANKDLSPALIQASKDGHEYEAAMQQALQALTNGATPDQARKVFEASLAMAMVEPIEITRLSLKFSKIDLDDPNAVRKALAEQMQGIYDNVGESVTYDSSQGDNIFKDIWLGVREMFGGDLSEPMKRAGTEAGQALMTGITAAGDDPKALGKVFDNIIGQTNKAMDGMVGEIQKNDKLKSWMKKYGIETADQLNDVWVTMNKNWEDHKPLTGMQQALADITSSSDEAYSYLSNFSDSYNELLDRIVSGMGLSEDEAKVMRARIQSLLDIKTGEFGLPKTFLSTADAMEQYGEAVSRSASSWANYSDEEKLAILNTYRAKAGMKDATTWTQGFKNAADDAATSTSFFGRALGGLTAAVSKYASGKIDVSPEDLSGAQQSAMQGAWSDIMGEAESRYDKMRRGVEDGIQAAGDLRQKGYDTEEKNQKAHFDQLEKDQDAYWDGIEKGGEKAWDQATKDAENYWDTLEKATDDAAEAEDKAFEARKKALDQEREDVGKAYDARIDAVQATIDAEEAAENQRQKIFEAEQTRISRMAERLNNSIDFNMALNSGNMDEAAKLSNDADARDQSWSNEDANANLTGISEKHKADLEAQIKVLQAEKEAKDTALQEEIDRVSAEQDAHQELHQQRMDEIKAQRDAALQALKDQEEADKENVALNRAADEERLKSSRQTSEEDLANRRQKDLDDTASHLKNEQTKTEIDKAELAQRLRVLQEFIPQNEAELRKHIADVEKAYSDYGLDLTAQGNGWAGEISGALQTNVDVAAAALQTQINWKQIAENIATQIGAGMGMTMAQVSEFLRTGVFPAGAPVVSQPYVPNANAAAKPLKTLNQAAGGRNLARHAGGPVQYEGRVGYPASASPYPSEIPILAKHGEYVVKAQHARRNAETLEAINSGKDIHAGEVGGPIGSFMEVALGSAALGIMTMAKVAQIAAAKKLQMGQEAAYAASMGGGTIDEGNGMIYNRLFSTVKRQFPRANLNDGFRPGANDMHGKGQAVDLGEMGFSGGQGRPYLADMNRWIYDSFPMTTQLIYDGLGDDRPDVLNGKDHVYNAATRAGHKHHVHWGMTPEAIALANARGLTGPGAVAAAPGNLSSNQQIVKSLAAQLYGWQGAQWDSLYKLVMGESGFKNTAQNPSSTAYGMFQFLNSTWGGTGFSKTSDPTIQTKAGLKYIQQAYGTPINAYAKWSSRSPHWYDNGGYLMPGENQLVSNGTRSPEPVFTGPQWDILKANIGAQTFDLPTAGNAMPVRLVDSSVATGQQNVYDIDIEFSGPINTDIDVKKAVWEALDERESRNGRRRVIS